MSKKNILTDKYIAFNSYGGFNNKKDEYHILNPNTPLPWCNIMANKNFGTIISSYGTVYSYFKNSREYKITEWCNDWVSFKPGEKFTGIFEKDYNLVYGFGYTNVVEEDKYFKKAERRRKSELYYVAYYRLFENTSAVSRSCNSYKVYAFFGFRSP